MSLRNQTVTKVNLAQVLAQEHSWLKVQRSRSPNSRHRVMMLVALLQLQSLHRHLPWTPTWPDNRRCRNWCRAAWALGGTTQWHPIPRYVARRNQQVGMCLWSGGWQRYFGMIIPLARSKAGRSVSVWSRATWTTTNIACQHAPKL